jgi:catechol 2,3-dioxygenase-like lactoylglutathione lyase family enzyme
MIFDHIGFSVADFKRSRAFYLAALAPLGIGILSEGKNWAMFGIPGQGGLWIGEHGPAAGTAHVAFLAPDRNTVRAFHVAAIAAGAPDNGAPGLRTNYHPTYYAAYALDPDGRNIEAVCHTLEL